MGGGKGVTWGPTMCRAKRFAKMFKAVEAVEADLVCAFTRTDIGTCTYQNILK